MLCMENTAFFFLLFLTPKHEIRGSVFHFPASTTPKPQVRWRCQYPVHAKVLRNLLSRMKRNIWYYEQIWSDCLLSFIQFGLKTWDETPQHFSIMRQVGFFSRLLIFCGVWGWRVGLTFQWQLVQGSSCIVSRGSYGCEREQAQLPSCLKYPRGCLFVLFGIRQF